MIRNYNTTFRKTLKFKISKVSSQRKLIDIYSIVVADISIDKISKNKSGAYFNLNLLSDEAIEEIINIL